MAPMSCNLDLFTHPSDVTNFLLSELVYSKKQVSAGTQHAAEEVSPYAHTCKS